MFTIGTESTIPIIPRYNPIKKREKQQKGTEVKLISEYKFGSNYISDYILVKQPAELLRIGGTGCQTAAALSWQEAKSQSVR